MRVAYNDQGDKAGLRGYMQFNKCSHTHAHTHTQWYIMARITGSDCAAMCNLINTNTRTHTDGHI